MSSTPSREVPARVSLSKNGRQASIAATWASGSGDCDPTWKLSPTTGTPKRAASVSSQGSAFRSQPNLRDRSLTTPLLRKETRSSRLAWAPKASNLANSSMLSTTNTLQPNSSASRMSRSRLIGWVWMVAAGSAPISRSRSSSPLVATSKLAPSAASVARASGCGSDLIA
jgi:hypothetical protein